MHKIDEGGYSPSPLTVGMVIISASIVAAFFLGRESMTKDANLIGVFGILASIVAVVCLILVVGHQGHILEKNRCTDEARREIEKLKYDLEIVRNLPRLR